MFLRLNLKWLLKFRTMKIGIAKYNKKPHNKVARFVNFTGLSSTLFIGDVMKLATL